MTNQNKTTIYCVLIAVVATAGVIYLTPLKWINVIEPKIQDIEPREFYEKFTKNPENYVFIDVRPADSFERTHAVGSVSMPLHTLYDEHRSLPKRGKEIVLICSGGRASGVAYSYLEHHGFFNIWRIEGGIEYWMAQGLPIEGTRIDEIESLDTVSMNQETNEICV